MSEMLWNRYEEQENRNNQSISVFDGDKYQNDIQSFYLKNKENPETIQTLKDFLGNQEQDKNNIKEQLEKPVLQEAKEWLDKQAMINEAKTMLYEKMWISNNLWDNNWWENCWKWLVDTLILDNYDLAIQVWETNWAVIIDWITELFSSWENLQKVAESLWESVMWLFSWDWYETWKSFAELWLIWSWVWIWVYVWKKTVKFWMKQAAKFRKNAENIVSSLDTKQVIWEVNNKVNEIIPKQEVNIDELAKRRVDIKRQIEWLEKLWLPESFSKDMLESWILTPISWKGDFNLLKRYKNFNKNWIDYNTMINEVLKDIPNLSQKEALLIFSYTDHFLYAKLNSFMRWDKNILKNMTQENIEATNRIIVDLEQALEKMPDLTPWKDWFILRWDKSQWWNWNIWDKIELQSFTSVSNNKQDIFIWKFWNDTQISIIWKEWRVKDISSLAIAVKFWDKIDIIDKTINEWIILPKSKVEVIDRFKLENINYIDVKQTE